jgi:hypothetical protein
MPKPERLVTRWNRVEHPFTLEELLHGINSEAGGFA